MNGPVYIPELEDFRRVIREELEARADADRLYNVESAAEYLDTTEEALRGLIKRNQIECNRSETGRITFTRQQLDAYAGVRVAA